MCEKVATLTRRIESQNQAWEHRLETELTRAKETAIAGEKIRREKWIRDNTKKIKVFIVRLFSLLFFNVDLTNRELDFMK